MSIRVKDFIVGNQKNQDLPGAEAYAYARQMEAIRKSNPNYKEPPTYPILYTLIGYACAFGSLWMSMNNDLAAAGWLAVASFAACIVGSIKAK